MKKFLYNLIARICDFMASQSFHVSELDYMIERDRKNGTI